MDLLKVLFAATITLMYFLSGFDKLLTPEAERKKLADRLHAVPWLRWASEPTVVAAGVAAAGMLQAIAPPLVVYGASSREDMWRRAGRYSAWALAAFTVVVTALFFTPPLGAGYYPFVSNVAAFGGLMLLAHTM